jgi:hypothetical protein
MNPPEFCLLGINWWPLCMAKGEWASWVQAVFSVVAIGAAIWIGHRTDAKARLGARNHFWTFKSSAKSAIRYVMNAALEQDFFNYSLGRAMVHDAIQLGQTVPLHLLTGENAFTATRYRAVLSTAEAAVEADPNAPAWVSIEFKQKVQVLGELLEDLKRVDEQATVPVVDDWN